VGRQWRVFAAVTFQLERRRHGREAVVLSGSVIRGRCVGFEERIHPLSNSVEPLVKEQAAYEGLGW